MRKNMGTADRVIRLFAAFAVAALYFSGQIGGIAAVLLGLISAVFMLTSVVGTCPLYAPFGITTRAKSSQKM